MVFKWVLGFAARPVAKVYCIVVWVFWVVVRVLTGFFGWLLGCCMGVLDGC